MAYALVGTHAANGVKATAKQATITQTGPEKTKKKHV